MVRYRQGSWLKELLSATEEGKDNWLRINIENLFGIGYFGLGQEFMVNKLKSLDEQEPTDV